MEGDMTALAHCSSLALDLGLFAGLFWSKLLDLGLETSLDIRWIFCERRLFSGHDLELTR